MTKIALSLFLLGACNGIFAMEGTIRLASTQDLNKRLCSKGFDHFTEKTQIDKTLGSQVKAPLGVAMAVELALYDYDQYIQNPMTDALMQMLKPQLIETILEEHPKAIEELKQHGLLK